MTAAAATPAQGMNVDECLAWAKDKPGRYELYCGFVCAMSPERPGNPDVKFAVQTGLNSPITAAALPCHMTPAGMTERVNDEIACEPDALVSCGPEFPRRQVENANPITVVEVSSPPERSLGTSAKLSGYFHLTSVQHCLIGDPERRPTLHHTCQTDGTDLSRIVASGPITLDPPGTPIGVSAFLS